MPTVRAYDRDWILVDQQRFEQTVVVSALPGQAPQAVADDGQPDALAQALQALSQSGAETVIYGSGARLVFPPRAWMQAFAQARVGLEVMDTAAACRTYNILAGEGRKVVALLRLPA